MGKQRGSSHHLLTLERAVLEHMPAPRADLPLAVLPDHQARLEGLIEAMHAWVCEFDADGRMTYASSQIESVLGFTPEESLEKGLEFHPEDLSVVVALGRKVRESGESGQNQARIRHKLGHWVWVETSLVAWSPSEDEGFHTVAFSRDISEVKAFEAAQRESEERYRAVSEMSRDLIFELNAQGWMTYVGPGAGDIIGYSREEALAIEPWSLIHPDDVDAARDQIAQVFSQAAQGKKLSLGRFPPVECRLRHRDGRWLWFETLGITYQQANGEWSYLGVARDVTDQKRTEQQRRDLEESMQRAQKLESLGVLASGIAHDFNNLLTPILGAAGLALSEVATDSPVRARLLKIQLAASRAAALTTQMLSYAGQQPLSVERLDLSQIVAEMRALIASSISGRAELDLQLEPDLPAVEGEATQLGQVVMNLITNAAESLADGVGTITVRTGLVTLDAPPSGALFAETLVPGRHVYFEVADDGCGMDPATCARVFEPFFTTKFTGRGLGLAAVAGIARGHRGAIEVKSQLGEGTCFRLLLPALSGGVSEQAVAPVPLDRWQATGTALVIDDDDGVRELTEEVLRRAGMAVLTAVDGHEGVKLFGQHADEIRVVLLDRTMPSLSGSDTLNAIRELRPDAQVVIVSGYSEERVIAEMGGQRLAGFLKKPFFPETLLAEVRAVLERNDGR